MKKLDNLLLGNLAQRAPMDALNPNSAIERGAHAPRVLFSAPSRKTGGARNRASSQNLGSRHRAGCEGASSDTRGRVCSPTSEVELKRKGSATVRQIKAWFMLCLIVGLGFGLPLSVQAAEADHPTDAEQFKAFLASPPAIEKFVFRRTSRLPTANGGEEIRVEFYHARWQTNGFFMRQLHQLGDMDLPHLLRTGVKLGQFAGRYEDTAWILLGEGAHYMTPLGTNRENLVVSGQSSAVSVLQHALNMGVTKVPFGSFKWQGNKFEAPADDGTTIRGSLIQTTDGRPKQLKFIVNSNLFALLDYSYTKKLDLAFMPDKFSFTSVNIKDRFTNTYAQFEIYALKPSATVMGAEYFKPDEYITRQNTKNFETWTNNTYSYSINGIQMFSGVTPPPWTKAKPASRSYLLLFLLPTMLLIAFFLHKQKQTNKNKTV